MNVDEMVIASSLLMVGLEGCQRMTCAAKLFCLFVSPHPNITSEYHLAVAEVPVKEQGTNR